jgi:hypothetical protein
MTPVPVADSDGQAGDVVVLAQADHTLVLLYGDIDLRGPNPGVSELVTLVGAEHLVRWEPQVAEQDAEAN